MVYHGTVKDGVVELENGTTLPDGTRVKVEPLSRDPVSTPARPLGTLRGTVSNMSDDFDAPLDDFEDCYDISN